MSIANSRGPASLAALAAETGALRLTPDEWQTRLFADDMHHPDHDRRHGEVEAIMWELAVALLSRGLDVILDFGFWAREERMQFAQGAAEIGAECRIHYVDVPLLELERRVVERNVRAGTGYFIIPVDKLRQWAQQFEPPDADELAGRFSPLDDARP